MPYARACINGVKMILLKNTIWICSIEVLLTNPYYKYQLLNIHTFKIDANTSGFVPPNAYSLAFKYEHTQTNLIVSLVFWGSGQQKVLFYWIVIDFADLFFKGTFET